ncbi:MAG: acyl carrier protein [Actinobacteria bacterium]|nr:acyl carrier protein [Actinomycetota bacterium]
MPTLEELREQVDRRKEMCAQVKQLVVDRLDVPVEPQWITDDQPLFGRGLELDSVDALELVVGLEYDFAVSVTDDQLDVFGSVARLAEHIEAEL